MVDVDALGADTDVESWARPIDGVSAGPPSKQAKVRRVLSKEPPVGSMHSSQTRAAGRANVRVTDPGPVTNESKREFCRSGARLGGGRRSGRDDGAGRDGGSRLGPPQDLGGF